MAEAQLVEKNALFRQTCVAMGVPVSWFQSKVNARWLVNWRKVRLADLPNTDEVLRFAYDLGAARDWRGPRGRRVAWRL